MKDRIIKDINNFFEPEEENYQKPARVINFWSNNCIEYECNCNRNKALSVEEYVNKIRLSLKCIVNNLKKSDTCKIQLAIANNIISSTNNDKEHGMYPKNDNIKIMISDEADEVIK